MEYKEEYAQVNQNTETDAEYTPQFDGLVDEAPDCESPVVVAQPAKKKKFPIYIPIIIAAVLVVLSVAAFFVSPVTVAATAVNCSSLALSTGTLASGIASALSPLPKNGSFSCYAVETTWTELTTTQHGDKTNYLYTTYSITTIYVWNDEIDGEEGWAVWYEMGSIVSQRELCY